MHKPTVIFYNRVYPPVRGATGRVLRDLARAFVRDGWDVTVVTSGPVSRKDRDGVIRIIRVRSPRGRSLLAYVSVWIRMLITGLRQPRPDLIVTMTDPPFFVIAGRLLARVQKAPHMHWCQDLYPDILPALGIRMPQFLFRTLKIMSRRAMKSCEKVVVVGRCMARHLTHSGMDPQRIAVIPNWPDAELAGGGRRRLLRPRIIEVDGARPYEQLFRDADPKFRVLYSGNIGRAHPVDTILEAAELLAVPHPEIEFVFVGDGPRFDRLVQERARRGLENIRFLPWQPASRLKELMESGDIHIITMKDSTEGMLVPSKLYSAMAVARPCIFVGPQTSETAKVIQDFRAGTIIPQGEGRALAEAIRAYRTNSNIWFAAHEGARHAGSIFIPEQSINAWLERARTVARIPARPMIRRKAA